MQADLGKGNQRDFRELAAARHSTTPSTIAA
jgi:hypothetical protein